MRPYVHKTQLQQCMAFTLPNTVNMEREPLELGPRETTSISVRFSLQGTPIKTRP